MQSITAFDAQPSFSIAWIIVMTQMNDLDLFFFFLRLKNRFSTSELVIPVGSRWALDIVAMCLTAIGSNIAALGELLCARSQLLKPHRDRLHRINYVVMAAGLAANLTVNPFESVTTVTTQIVQLLTGDQEFESAKTLAAFALGLALFVITLILNLIALSVVRRYREAYE